ncbi:MAG: AmmeMemoRadiSam system protein A [Betaproteobacteria bacterium]|nr:AmmeMemoRadiSam system protein A [Betaproteobacteria bacterium]
MDNDLGNLLLALARNAIAEKLDAAHTPDSKPATHPALLERGAVFVTLTQNGALRGCIGSLEAWRPLHEDISANAVAAALRDPRFPPLSADELGRTRVEVSLLTPAQPMSFANEADAIGQLRPHIDGVILEYGKHRGTFLPQVWESLPEPREFMAQLKRKAGLPLNFWSNELKLSRYQVEKWKEPA